MMPEGPLSLYVVLSVRYSVGFLFRPVKEKRQKEATNVHLEQVRKNKGASSSNKRDWCESVRFGVVPPPEHFFLLIFMIADA